MAVAEWMSSDPGTRAQEWEYVFGDRETPIFFLYSQLREPVSALRIQLVVTYGYSQSERA
jgi:hypothetical protein